jgi:hypothetical protein
MLGATDSRCGQLSRAFIRLVAALLLQVLAMLERGHRRRHDLEEHARLHPVLPGILGEEGLPAATFTIPFGILYLLDKFFHFGDEAHRGSTGAGRRSRLVTKTPPGRGSPYAGTCRRRIRTVDPGCAGSAGGRRPMTSEPVAAASTNESRLATTRLPLDPEQVVEEDLPPPAARRALPATYWRCAARRPRRRGARRRR